MSITQEEYRTWLRKKLKPLSLREKIHSALRMLKKIWIIHNVVGDVYMRRKTIAEFQSLHPTVYYKIKGCLRPFVEGDYISEEGWDFFLEYIWEPRDEMILEAISTAKQKMYDVTASNEFEIFE